MAESVWRTTLRSSRCLMPKGFQSTLRMAPGPGARLTVSGGFNLLSTKVLGFPLWSMPDHCSHWTDFLLCPSRVVRPKVDSSASTSVQEWQLPNTISFSRRSTWASKDSYILWLTWKSSRAQAVLTLAKRRSRTAAWSWRGLCVEPVEVWKRGCRWCGRLAVHRYCGISFLVVLVSLPFQQCGQTFLCQSGSRPSSWSICTIWRQTRAQAKTDSTKSVLFSRHGQVHPAARGHRGPSCLAWLSCWQASSAPGGASPSWQRKQKKQASSTWCQQQQML